MKGIFSKIALCAVIVLASVTTVAVANRLIDSDVEQHNSSISEQIIINDVNEFSKIIKPELTDYQKKELFNSKLRFEKQKSISKNDEELDFYYREYLIDVENVLSQEQLDKLSIDIINKEEP